MAGGNSPRSRQDFQFHQTRQRCGGDVGGLGIFRRHRRQWRRSAAFINPGAQDLIFGISATEPAAPLMRHVPEPLLQNQALVGGRGIRASAVFLMRQRDEVEIRIETAQTQPKSVLTLGRAMARSLIATSLAEGRNHIGIEVNRVGTVIVPDFDGNPSLTPAERDNHFARSKCPRHDQAGRSHNDDRGGRTLVSRLTCHIRERARRNLFTDNKLLRRPMPAQGHRGRLHKHRSSRSISQRNGRGQPNTDQQTRSAHRVCL